MARDFSGKVVALLGYSYALPDMTAADYAEAGLTVVEDMTGAVFTNEPAVDLCSPINAACPPFAEGEEARAQDAFGAAVPVIAAHYGLDEGEVWSVMWDLESEMCERGGLPWLGRLITHSHVGLTALGIRAAERITGLAQSDLPPPFLPPEPPVLDHLWPEFDARGQRIRTHLVTRDQWAVLMTAYALIPDMAEHLGVSSEMVRQVLASPGVNINPPSVASWASLAGYVRERLGLSDDGGQFMPTIQ